MLTGGKVINNDGGSANSFTTCDRPNGWAAAIKDFLDRLFTAGDFEDGGGEVPNPDFGTNPEAPTNVVYGPNPYSGSAPGVDSNGGNNVSNANVPYQGGPIWVSKWIPPTNPCDVPSSGPNTSDCDEGYWEYTDASAQASTFDNLDHPIDYPEEPVTDYGIGIVDLSSFSQPGRLIGTTTDRGNTEDMTHSYTGDKSGIKLTHDNEPDNILFDRMTALMHFASLGEMQNVVDLMIDKFRKKEGGTFENTTLNSNVRYSSQFKNFIGYFGEILNQRLSANGGNLNAISKIDIDRHPIFNGFFNKWHGLMITLDDTEYTEIKINDYQLNGTQWSATLDVVIHDHFGVDKADALAYQTIPFYGLGFADWWLLQHTRDFRPFETIVHVQVGINGHF